MNNPSAALGQLKELEGFSKTSEYNRILAIAFFHNGQFDEANRIWIELGL